MGTAPVVVPRINLIAAGEWIEDLAHGVKHGVGIAIAAPVNKERIAGEDRGIIAQAVDDTIHRVSRCMEALDIYSAEWQLLPVREVNIMPEGAGRVRGDVCIEKPPGLGYSRAMVVVPMGQKNVPRMGSREFRNRILYEPDIAGRVHERSIPALFVMDEIGKI